MQNYLSKKLFTHVIGNDDVQAVSESRIKNTPLTNEIINDLLTALSSKQSLDVTLACFFASSLDISKLEPHFINQIVELALHILNNQQSELKSSAVDLVIKYRKYIPSYRNIMLNLLKDEDDATRGKVLASYLTFAHKNEFEPLEPFENDDYVSEIAMGSPLYFVNRNDAFDLIEKITGNKFDRFEILEKSSNGKEAYMIAWAPFHYWKNSFWRKFFRKK